MCEHKKESGKVCNGLHAEQRALLIAKPGDELYVARFRKDGSMAEAKPCTECQKEIKRRGVKVVWYTTYAGTWEQLELN